MTPKKDIVRRPVYTLDDGSTVPSMGKESTMKESRFIFWYTYPGTEAFMNAGRAAVRAGYKPENAVMQGYLLKRKPEIANRIDDILGHTKEGMRNLLYRIAFLCRDRMFFDITDFYRPCKRIIKVRGKEVEKDSLEIIPLDEISERNRMCIDNIEFKGPKNVPVYKLPDRNKAMNTFFRCVGALYGKTKDQVITDTISGKWYDNEDTDWKKTAEIIRGGIRPPVIAPGHGKAPENPIEVL
jgi:hypothetical protein